MKTLKFKLIPIISSFAFVTAIAIFLVKSEQVKKDNRLNTNRQYYSEIYQNWLSYKTEYETALAKIREENLKAMETAKNEFTTLLAQQPDIIREHTTTGTTYVAKNTTTIANGSSGAGSQTVKVSKPVSKPKTKTS